VPIANTCPNMLAAFPAYPTSASGGGVALGALLSSMGAFAASVSFSSLDWDNSLGVWDFECTLEIVGSCPEAQDVNDLSELVEHNLFSEV